MPFPVKWSNATTTLILVHAGFGIQIVDEHEAQETLELVNSMTELVEEDQLATNPAEAY